MIQKTDIKTAFEQIENYWDPHVAGELNGQHIKLAKFKGSFDWHHHEHEDEMFLVIKGQLLMKLRTGDIEVGKGEFIIIPRGTEHCPVAQEETWVMLFEPAGTLNTGNVITEKTVTRLKSI